MQETITQSRFITRKEIIAEVGIGAYNRAVETKQLKVIQFCDTQNGKQRVERSEYEAWLLFMKQK